MTAATHARLCNTAPQAPDSELRTSYIVIRTFKLRFINRNFQKKSFPAYANAEKLFFFYPNLTYDDGEQPSPQAQAS